MTVWESYYHALEKGCLRIKQGDRRPTPRQDPGQVQHPGRGGRQRDAPLREGGLSAAAGHLPQEGRRSGMDGLFHPHCHCT